MICQRCGREVSPPLARSVQHELVCGACLRYMESPAVAQNLADNAEHTSITKWKMKRDG